jgi:hypothetical protein
LQKREKKEFLKKNNFTDVEKTAATTNEDFAQKKDFMKTLQLVKVQRHSIMIISITTFGIIMALNIKGLFVTPT